MIDINAKTCGRCADGWVCEDHPDKPWPHYIGRRGRKCGAPGMPCENPGCHLSIDPVPERWVARNGKKREI